MSETRRRAWCVPLEDDRRVVVPPLSPLCLVPPQSSCAFRVNSSQSIQGMENSRESKHCQHQPNNSNSKLYNLLDTQQPQILETRLEVYLLISGQQLESEYKKWYTHLIGKGVPHFGYSVRNELRQRNVIPRLSAQPSGILNRVH